MAPRSRLVSLRATMTDSTPRPTLQLTTRRLQDATSGEAPYWTGQQFTRAQHYCLLQLREINFIARFSVFPLMRCFKDFNT